MINTKDTLEELIDEFANETGYGAPSPMFREDDDEEDEDTKEVQEDDEEEQGEEEPLPAPKAEPEDKVPAEEPPVMGEPKQDELGLAKELDTPQPTSMDMDGVYDSQTQLIDKMKSTFKEFDDAFSKIKQIHNDFQDLNMYDYAERLDKVLKSLVDLKSDIAKG